MSMPAFKADPPAAKPAAPAEVLPLPKRPPALLGSRLGERARGVASVVLPPVVTLAVLLFLWQGLTGDSMGGLPSPTSIWRDSRELILNPFFDRGGVDKGLFWHVLTSLSRVGFGFSLAAPESAHHSTARVTCIGPASYSFQRGRRVAQ